MKEWKNLVDINMRRLGRNIGRAIDSKNISQTEFAYGIGISREHFCSVINGYKMPSLHLLTVIAAETETDFNTLLEGVITRTCE